ncbi:nonsense-mediated mRNA decay factor SMG5 isoform X2 [Bombina bombina]|uniref:nonsense-mediated mRNA decay factor SMG5 isoform X2 n=1 Tax=Bombina bombina TaxID=8345 RepID=UPI00235B1688|nr:nonsense-mediated mRNA decay factor SMG5 isoform X2 [Bombina bombina]
MSQGTADSEPEAKVLHTKRLYRAVVETVHRLDVIISNKTAYQEVFKPENISLRNKLRELCVKLMFLHPVEYGRKAEEVLWRKVYYDVIQLIKTNKKHIHSRSALECAYRTHLIAGVGFYQHLLLYIQSHYQLELQCCIDWTHVTDPLIGCKKPVSASAKEMDWAQLACHRCLVYLGDLARYQNELALVDTEKLAERFYYQALTVVPQIGMPFNQLGTLAGSKYYHVEATYCYLRCIQSEISFDGAYGNLKRLYDKAAKMYHQLRKSETRKLSPSKKRCKDIKRLLVSFMYLQSLLQPKSISVDSELTTLCQSVLEDFNLCMFYLPSSINLSSASEDEDEYEGGYSFLPDLLVFRMVVICLMSVHSLKRADSKQYSAAIAFTLALFSHLVNHVNIRLQAELEENPVPAFQNDIPDDPDFKEVSDIIEKETGTTEPAATLSQVNKQPKPKTERKKSRKYSRLSRLRRRRHIRKVDESDLSEGFDSDSSHGSGKGSDISESASEKSDEEGAFDMETDSDMNSQESRSDLEDMEDESGEEAKSNKGFKDINNERTEEPEIKAENTKIESQDPPVNGPGSGSSETSIASNLQAMSTQMFQTKRCFRLAPTFSNVFVKPVSEPAAPTPEEQVPLVNGDVEKPSAVEQEDASDSEESVLSNKSCRNEKSLQEKLEIITCEGLLASVKVFLDWLRTNTDIIIMCAQSSQSLWNRMSVLLNLLPAASKIQEAGISLCNEVKNLLRESEYPEIRSHLLLPEDMALRNLPPLRGAHRKVNFDQERPVLSVLEEAQEEARRNRLMRDMAQLRLQLEVSQLEGTLQQPKSQSAMSPYLVPDTQALCQHLGIIRQLASSGRFIIIIPRTVIDGLDFLKKEHAGARDGIRYLEAEFKKGNRYIRCQRDVGKNFERNKLKRQDNDAWHLYKILDSCKQLTVSQGSSEEDTAGMVTIITGFQLDDADCISDFMQSALQAASSASIEIKNVLDFYKQWKEMG